LIYGAGGEVALAVLQVRPDVLDRGSTPVRRWGTGADEIEAVESTAAKVIDHLLRTDRVGRRTPVAMPLDAEDRPSITSHPLGRMTIR
jgi:hypothetical protein